MRESTLMQMQYVTAVLAVLLVGVHLLMQGVLVPYTEGDGKVGGSSRRNCLAFEDTA
ncbi:MAG: hypothetical protein JRM90_02050 [Nitrososphaerota archaeon]|nr:hypothetical protein [Nitrososphaerota archaeon]